MKFLDIEVIWHSDNTVETVAYYKYKNAHDYLQCNSEHPKHCKGSFPCNLANRIIVLISNDEKVEMRLKELKNWWKDCNYLENVINRFLQGPAPSNDKSKNISFVTTYYENVDNEKVVKKIVLACQIFNLDIFQKYLKIKMLCFRKNNQKLTPVIKQQDFIQKSIILGIETDFLNVRKNVVKFVLLYIVEGRNFIMSNIGRWEVWSHVTCRSINIIWSVTCVVKKPIS